MTTYFVSTTGNDANDGLASDNAHAWRHIQWAADHIASGDTVKILGGTYAEKVTIPAISGAWTTFQNYNTASVIVNGSGAVAYDGIFRMISDCDHIHITGLEITNTGGYGILMVGAEITDIHVDYCTIHDCEASGIHGTSAGQPTEYIRRVEFDHNTVYDVNNGLSDQVTWSPNEAISFSNIQGFEIHHNNLSLYGKEGIDCKSGSNNGSVHHNTIITSLPSPAFQWDYNHIGIYIDGFSRIDHDISVYNNKITGYGGVGITLDAEQPGSGGQIQNIYVYNNVVDISFQSSPSGYGHFRVIDSSYNSPWMNVQIYNNTFHNGDTTANANAPRIFPTAANLTGLVIENNIFTGILCYYLIYFQSMSSLEYASHLTLSNNVFFDSGATARNHWSDGDNKTWGSNAILTDPKYMNIGAGDLHLQETSPAKDTGITVTLTFDFDDFIRPWGVYYDRGAYEYGSEPPDEPGLFGFYDDGYTITQGSMVATMAQPMVLIPTKNKRVDTYVFRDKTTTTVDAGKETDRLSITGLEFYSQSNCQKINDMLDIGQRVYIANLGDIPAVDAGYIGWYYITSFNYVRKAGVMNKSYYELVLDSET